MMTYLGKKPPSDESENGNNANGGCNNNNNNNAVANLVKKDDILKQSIKTTGYEDTSLFFVQSGDHKSPDIR